MADRVLRPLQFVIASMIVGILAFGLVAVIAGGIRSAGPPVAPVLLPALGAVALAEIPAYILVRQGIVERLRRRLDQSAADLTAYMFVGPFTTLTIIGGALAEGPSLFGIVVYWVTGDGLALVVPLVGVLVLARLYPTRGRLCTFLSRISGRPWEDTETR